jgi:pimeloyl-ACP methyl ester carboxylesterase
MTQTAAGLALAVTGFLVYMYVASGATAEARDALRTDAGVTVTVRADDVLFVPSGQPRTTGLLFLPGTPVDPIAYAPLTRAIAARGYPTAVVMLPRRGLASSKSPQLAARADAAMRTLGAKRWVVAGHSRGGDFGARLVLDHPGQFSALVLIATTHPRSFSLADASVDVTQVSGDRDGTASDQELAEARTRLPAGTRHVVIPGANHSQFGFYGGHPFDGTPAISRASQIERTIDVLLAVLERADRKPDPQGTLLRSSDVSFRQ